MAIVISAEEPGTMPITLVGKKYTITPPKASLAMKMAIQAKTHPEDVIDTLNEWLARAFGDKFDVVSKRLEDPKDLLDIPHIMELVEAIMEEQTGGNPPT